ncbi:MAG: RsmB/NOP family class I SAM-dependent RNA methyltransferase [bacterium]|nr:RsmB/NOP family class I SAM-dependent RNA methyltransferase [bacterium]
MTKTIPGTEKIELKERFIERYSKLTDFDEFMKYSFSFLRRSIRVNTLKKPVDEVKKSIEAKGWKLEQVPWCKEGFWITSERRDVGNLQEHALGYIYVQEAASMIPPIVLNPKPGEIVLDMCASPGSKATQLAALMQNQGILIANDIKGDRIKPLGLNMQRSGISNSIITLMHGQGFKELEFDKILVDAPCSGTGTIRKSLKTIDIWNPAMVKRLAGTQRRLIETAFKILRKGGTLVYSTCSVEPEENEAVIDFLLENHKDASLEEIKLDIKRSEPILEFDGKQYNPEIKKCLRIWPQDNDTEGFFVTRIRKN